MRAKIIWVFSIVVVVVVALSFGLMRMTLGDVSNRDDAPRAVTAAVTQLEVEGLRVERWLAAQAVAPAVRELFLAGTPGARAKTATEVADTINEAAKRDPVFATIAPALVVIVDAQGVVIGRNGSALMRGQQLGQRYPALVETIKAGRTGSDVWVSQAHNEQLLASYAPIRDTQGQPIGGIAVGTPFSDERLSQTVGSTGSMLVAAVPTGGKLDLPAKSNGVTGELTTALASPEATRAIAQAGEAAGLVDLAGLPAGYFGSARRLAGYGDGRRAVIMAVTPAKVVGGLGSLLWPALGVILLGIIVTIVCAYLLDNYISRPIADLEEILLSIINGQRDLRIDYEHAVLGGLVFRINSLLNELLGVQEDTTDAEGRPSIAPAPAAFSPAFIVDERYATLAAAAVPDAHALGAEEENAYFHRLHGEYVAAKQALGERVDRITLAAFTDRVKVSQRELRDKHQRPYRFRVAVEDRDVVLVAVPLT